MSQQKYDVGDVVDGLEVVAVRYDEVEGEKVNFEYALKDPVDIVRPEDEEAQPAINEDLSEGEA